MSDQMVGIAALAEEALASFTRVKRGDEWIDTLKDDAPEWVRDLVYVAHGDMLPDDWRYSAIAGALAMLDESGAESRDDCDDLDHEYADGMVDVYTGERLQWLSSHARRPGYVDQGVDELRGADLDTVERVGLGQYMEAREVFASVLESLVGEQAGREEMEA